MEAEDSFSSLTSNCTRQARQVPMGTIINNSGNDRGAAKLKVYSNNTLPYLRCFARETCSRGG